MSLYPGGGFAIGTFRDIELRQYELLQSVKIWVNYIHVDATCGPQTFYDEQNLSYLGEKSEKLLRNSDGFNKAHGGYFHNITAKIHNKLFIKLSTKICTTEITLKNSFWNMFNVGGHWVREFVNFLLFKLESNPCARQRLPVNWPLSNFYRTASLGLC